MSLAVLQADCKRAVQSLTNLSNDQLDEIMNNDEKIQNILLGIDQSYLKEIESEKENLLALNASLAEENLGKEPELVEGREKLLEVTDEAEQLSKNVEEKTKELKNKTGDMSLETALALLQTAASEVEEESDKFAKKFLEHEVDLDEFLDQFQAKRRTMHLRLVKAEKMAKILSRDPMGNATNYMNAPPVALNTNYFPGVPSVGPNPSVPYPTGPLNMPMPPGLNFFSNHY